MDVNQIIKKIKSEPRELYDVPAMLCLDDVLFSDLISEAKKSSIVNQLGVLVDITLSYVISTEHEKYCDLVRLKDALKCMKNQVSRPFYDESSEITDAKKKMMSKLNESKMCAILNDWDVVAILSPDKFKQGYNQYEDRKTPAERYSLIH